MTKKMGVILDAPEFIQADHDSSLVLMAEAKKRGYEIVTFEQHELSVNNGIPFYQDNPLSIFDIILMRKDPPVDMQYIYTTLILELAEKEGVKIINRPQSLRDFNEKLIISYFPQCCVPTAGSHGS